MNILIIGSGMYVTGRGGTGVGTILASVMQVASTYGKSSVNVCATKAHNGKVVQEAANRINGLMKTNVPVLYHQIDGTDDDLASLVSALRISVCIVASPDKKHFSQLATLLALGVHCLCVKPLVLSLREHTELIQLTERYNVYGAVEFHKRWDETNLYARKLIKGNTLGDILNISIDYSQQIKIPSEVFSEWVGNTNIFQYLGIHYVDLVAWLTGATPVRLVCHGSKAELVSRNIDTWDSVHVWLFWVNDKNREFLTQYNLSWVDSNTSPALSDQSYKILGSQGRAEVDQRNRGFSLTLQGSSMQYINPWFSEFLEVDEDIFEIQGYGVKSITQFIYDCKDILDGVAEPKKYINNRPSFQNCLASTKVIEAVNKCLKDGITGEISL